LQPARSKWWLKIGDHPKVGKLSNAFHMERVKVQLSVVKVIGEKRPTFKQLIIRNYKPKIPL
jgi:hypothetical protein